MLSREQFEIHGFNPPEDYLRLVQVGITRLEPWRWLEGTRFDFRLSGLAQRYPSRDLLPFAERQDCDDIACWDKAASGRVVIIHDYAESGWESKATFGSWREWLHQALNDCLDFV